MKQFSIHIALNEDDDWDGWLPVVVLANPESDIDGLYVDGQMHDSSDEEHFEETGKAPYLVIQGEPLKDSTH